MPELLKNIYSQQFFESFTKVLQTVIPGFNKDKFLSHIYDTEWERRELKQRMRHISTILKDHLSDNYEESVNQLLNTIRIYQTQNYSESIPLAELALIFIPDFIEQNGINEFDISVSAFEKITQFTSCEFAVRPFIIKYKDEMLDKMLIWTKHENEHVRRLASEGSRSRLPWAMAIPFLKTNPSPILPILKALKSDSSEYVRRSVANSLNDISKDNPLVVVEIAKRWIGQTKETDRIVKHACRTLLKEGNQEVLQLFDFGSIETIEIKKLQLLAITIKVGENLEFEFELHNKSATTEKIRIEYGIYYQKQNGSLSRKVYKISEKYYLPNSVTLLNRRQSFKPISTRKFYAGKHKLSIIINGVECAEIEFDLNQ